jgi:hypothetical protein
MTYVIKIDFVANETSKKLGVVCNDSCTLFKGTKEKQLFETKEEVVKNGVAFENYNEAFHELFEITKEKIGCPQWATYFISVEEVK